MGVPEVPMVADPPDELVEGLVPPAMDPLLGVHPVGALDPLSRVPPHTDHLPVHRVVVVEVAIQPARDLPKQRRHGRGPTLIDVEPHGV